MYKTEKTNRDRTIGKTEETLWDKILKSRDPMTEKQKSKMIELMTHSHMRSGLEYYSNELCEKFSDPLSSNDWIDIVNQMSDAFFACETLEELKEERDRAWRNAHLSIIRIVNIDILAEVFSVEE